MSEIETHPFKAFVPADASCLIVGSFPAREVTHRILSEDEWFYGSKRNQFWNIISGVYETALPTRKEKQRLFEQHGIGIADLFLKIRRKENNNTDANLEVIVFNDEELKYILQTPGINKIFFTSKFVEKAFNKMFPAVTGGECLPSPSPRYARMSMADKIKYYRLKLPQ